MDPKYRYNIGYTLKFNDDRPDKPGNITNITNDSEVFLLKTIATREANFKEVEICFGSIYPIVTPYKTARLFSYSKDEIEFILRRDQLCNA